MAPSAGSRGIASQVRPRPTPTMTMAAPLPSSPAAAGGLARLRPRGAHPAARRRRPPSSAAFRRLRAPPSAILLLLLGLLFGRTGDDAAVAAAAASDDAKSSSQGVIALTAKNFDSSLRDGNAWLVEFYAPWCGHFVRFAPTYEQVAAQLHAKSAEAGAKRKVSAKGVAKVDGAAERALSSRFGVHGFPTFYLIDGWTVREFDGDRSLDNLVNFSLKDYEETEPIPFLFGPFGPMGQTRSLLMRSGTWAIGLYENPTKERGMKPLMAMAVLCVEGLTAGLVSIVVVGILFLPKAKQD